MMSPPPGARNEGPGHPWLDDDLTADEDRPADSGANLVSLGFFTAALRRSKWFWRVAAVVGLLIGTGLYLKGPHPAQASTTLLLSVGAEAQPGTAILEDQALAESHDVAGLALHNLGLHESVNGFLKSYTATPLTDRVLQITASAPSSDEAVRRANALADEFLTFRAGQLETEQNLELTALDQQRDQQVTQDKQHVASIDNQISKLSAQPASSSQRAKLSALHEQLTSANNDLVAIQQQISSSKAAVRVSTATMVGGSTVLDKASANTPPSLKKHLLLYSGGGLIIGLILGMGIVVIRALLSDRLRRRDDVAHALGAPVKLSVPAIRGGWLPGRRGRVSDRYMQRIVAYLRDDALAGPRAARALAVVPVDDPQVAARSLVSLAESCAQQGRQVVVADLCSGAPAAALLGAKDPGVHRVSADGAHLVAAVPDPAEFAPVGPLRPRSPQAQTESAGQLAAACASADLLLTLITLDPSVGGDHLATWAADAVVVVTAGRSSWTKIHAVAEMIRLAGARLAAGVLVGADKTDESLGVPPAPEAGSEAIMTQGRQADADGFPARAPRLTQGRQADADDSLAWAPRGRPSDDGPVSRLQMDRPEQTGHRRRTGR